MFSVHLSLAAGAVVALVLKPRSGISAAVVAVAAALDIALGARVSAAFAVVAPLVAFLTAALTLSALIASSGLADRAAVALARQRPGTLRAPLRPLRAADRNLSLDGAVVLIVPVIIALHHRYNAPVAALLLGAVAVANAASIAVPQGNPTNLVVINHLRLSPVAFTAHVLTPGLAAATICALASRSQTTARSPPPTNRPKHHLRRQPATSTTPRSR
jgi:Na+/H+ antiporter NhaD/arsenite permease-like protein